jgi:hypothetical protein
MITMTAGTAADTSRRPFVKRLVNRESLERNAASAVWGEMRNVPHEWGRGPAGFSKRFASAFGHHVVKFTIQTGVAAAHHEDLSYHPSNLHGTSPRLRYAVVSTFVVPRTNGPGHTAALGRISGNIGSGLISRLWQPASTAGLGAGIASGGIGLAADVGIHVAREFWPRRQRRP